MPTAYALYLHIPFCRHRCAYCDFNTYARKEAYLPAYVSALRREIAALGASAPERAVVTSIFFGGGTPSLLSAGEVASILAAAGQAFDLCEPEVSLEANPGTVSREGLRALRAAGVNRLSLGAQSTHPHELRQLEREHDPLDLIHAVGWARGAGFEDLNLDLIYGLPSQALSSWQASLRTALRLNPDHLSLYALSLEPGTPFGRWAARGLMPAPDPDLAAEMYTWAQSCLAEQGFEQYEISNWARPGHRCRHNLQYWRGLPYLGAGAGAHGYAAGVRCANVLRIKAYVDRLSQPPSRKVPFPLSPATVSHRQQSIEEEMEDFMLNGLRLTAEGVSARTFKDRFGRELEAVYGREIADLVRLGLLERQADRVRLTPRGRLLGNQVFLRFLSSA